MYIYIWDETNEISRVIHIKPKSCNLTKVLKRCSGFLCSHAKTMNSEHLCERMRTNGGTEMPCCVWYF